MTKKLTTLILSAILALTAMPKGALAEAGTVNVSNVTQLTDALSNSSVTTINLTESFATTQESTDISFILGNGGGDVAINGNGHTLTITMGGLVLGRNVTLSNITLELINPVRNAIFANGYTLTLNNVTVNTNTGGGNAHLLCGGITNYNGSNALPDTGGHGKVILTGSNSGFGYIFAGSLSDTSTADNVVPNSFGGNATISVPDGAGSSVKGIYASGALEPRGAGDSGFYPDPQNYIVTGDVAIRLGGSFTKEIDGRTGGSSNAALVYAGTVDYPRDAAASNMSGLYVESGHYSPSALDGNIPVSVSQGARLTLTALADEVTMGSFAGGGELVMKKSQTLSITGAVSGETTVAIGEIYDSASWDEASVGKTYIIAPNADGNAFTFLNDRFSSGIIPIFFPGAGIWSVPQSEDAIIISDISILPFYSFKETDASYDGVNIQYSIDYLLCPGDQDLGFVPLEITMTSKPDNTELSLSRSDSTPYYYNTGELYVEITFLGESTPIFYVYNEYSDENRELPIGSYAFTITVPSEYMSDGKERTLSFTVNVVAEGTNIQPITVTASEGGSVSGGGSYPEGAAVTITAVPDEGYLFSHWLEGETKLEGEAYSFTAAGETERAFTAVFVKDPNAVDTTAPVLTSGKATRTGETTATVTFRSDEAGTYYHSVGTPDFALSQGVPCGAGEVTISLGALTADGTTLYIMVRDAAGNDSDTLGITIPAYTAPAPPSGDSDTDENDPAGAPPPSSPHRTARADITARLSDHETDVELVIPKTGSPSALYCAAMVLLLAAAVCKRG